MDELYINYNGELSESSKPLFTFRNRGFLYGDSIFETMHCSTPHIYFFDDHMNRLFSAMAYLGMDKADSFTKEYIDFQIQKLLKRNRHFVAARVRLTVFRNNGGYYKPEDNNISYVIESVPINSKLYKLNETGMSLGVCHHIRKPISPLGQFKTGNSLIYVIACVFARKEGFDDVVILNPQGNIVEASSSNIFIVKGRRIYTPSLDEGCVDGIMRKKVISAAIRTGHEVFDNGPVTLSDLENADEVFLTNSVGGIIWVGAYNERRYYNKTARSILHEINRELSV